MSASAGIVPVRRFLFFCKVYVCRFILEKEGDMMKRNLLKGMAAVLAAAALTAVFAGCGGNKKDNGAAGKTADASSVKSDLLRPIPVPVLLTVWL